MRHDAIPLAAIASWRTLLGIDSDEEAVAAILHVRDNGEPAPDPETGENAWTSAYNAIENAINTITAPDDNTPDDPLTAGRTKTRGLLGLHPYHPPPQPSHPPMKRTPRRPSLCRRVSNQRNSATSLPRTPTTSSAQPTDSSNRSPIPTTERNTSDGRQEPPPGHDRQTP